MHAQQPLSPRDAADIRQIGIPPQARSRRLTQARVSAVCVQLGEHVSVRNVQRVLGGSLRDVTPMVRQWREDRSAVEAALASSDGDATEALGAIVLAKLEDLGLAFLGQRESASASMDPAGLLLAMRRLQDRLDRSAAGLAQQSAMDAQFRSLATRLDAVARTIDVAQVVAPAVTVDPFPALERIEAGLAHVAQEAVLDRLSVRGVETQMGKLAGEVAALRNETPSAASLEPLPPAVHALDVRLDTLGRSLRARGASPAIRKALHALECRLGATEELLVRLTGQLAAAQAASGRRGAKAPSPAATRRTARPTAKKATAARKPARSATKKVASKAPQRRTPQRKSAIGRTPPVRHRKKAGALRPSARRTKSTADVQARKVATRTPATPGPAPTRGKVRTMMVPPQALLVKDQSRPRRSRTRFAAMSAGGAEVRRAGHAGVPVKAQSKTVMTPRQSSRARAKPR